MYSQTITRIECESQVRLHGVIVDDTLKFNKHIDVLCRKANRQINVLCRFRNIFNIEEREVIHNTFILANFNYCPIICHFCDKASIHKMENEALKLKKELYDFFLMTRKVHIPLC